MNKFDFRGFSYQLQDHLTDQGVDGQVNAFHKDGKRNISVDFDADEDKVARKVEVEDYVSDNTDESKEVSAFFQDGKLRILIEFTEDTK